ncbi:TetR/AcrR family transcriptional regulator [Sulfurovum sp. XGS-02]|uniref:TetR/AcrR family transcriptional regulator n=1 Tax=Sulfurovum sp. XGS-02 TaxID=2925411 RepID=UPI00204559E8|nr:TetR/AcrR family transcriptional regulator [Sulfurovum sp. XGS-02]UPT78471.1 TetR/AcrR family transcriptional regulator [Sulfurovum sp. XGS-02]
MKITDKKAKKRESIIQTALQLFSANGFHKTTIPDIAKKMHMSVGNIYNYFSSKDILAGEIIKYTSNVLGGEIRKVNMLDISSKAKIKKIVEVYFGMAQERPEMIEYFLRVYLSHREVFKNECEEMVCVSGFITEIMIFFNDGVESGEFRNQDFFSAFGLFLGYLGGMVFLKGEGILPKEINEYIDDISFNIYHALKV